jgi:hypothetical protein
VKRGKGVIKEEEWGNDWGVRQRRGVKGREGSMWWAGGRGAAAGEWVNVWGGCRGWLDPLSASLARGCCRSLLLAGWLAGWGLVLPLPAPSPYSLLFRSTWNARHGGREGGEGVHACTWKLGRQGTTQGFRGEWVKGERERARRESLRHSVLESKAASLELQAGVWEWRERERERELVSWGIVVIIININHQ